MFEKFVKKSEEQAHSAAASNSGMSSTTGENSNSETGPEAANRQSILMNQTYSENMTLMHELQNKLNELDQMKADDNATKPETEQEILVSFTYLFWSKKNKKKPNWI